MKANEDSGAEKAIAGVRATEKKETKVNTDKSIQEWIEVKTREQIAIRTTKINNDREQQSNTVSKALTDKKEHSDWKDGLQHERNSMCKEENR